MTDKELGDAVDAVTEPNYILGAGDRWRLREAARRLRDMPDGERIEGWADSDYGDDDYDSGLMDFWAGGRPTHDTRDAIGREMVIWVRATLILHPQEHTE